MASDNSCISEVARFKVVSLHSWCLRSGGARWMGLLVAGLQGASSSPSWSACALDWCCNPPLLSVASRFFLVMLCFPESWDWIQWSDTGDVLIYGECSFLSDYMCFFFNFSMPSILCIQFCSQEEYKVMTACHKIRLLQPTKMTCLRPCLVSSS